MKPVNLLPEEHRPSRPSGNRSGVAYPVLGVLAVVLVAVLAYVLTLNEVSSKQDRAAQLAKETQVAQAEAGSLGPVSNFLSIKQAREQSVRDLAGRRFDWERLTRELAKVIPAGVYVKEVKASVTGEGVTATAAKAAAPAAAGATGGSPALTLMGCATGQRQVATLLVRLKQMHLVEDVTLDESKSMAEEEGNGNGSSGTASIETPCSRYEFKLTVTFDPASVAMTSPGEQEPVPAALGGGK